MNESQERILVLDVLHLNLIDSYNTNSPDILVNQWDFILSLERKDSCTEKEIQIGGKCDPWITEYLDYEAELTKIVVQNFFSVMNTWDRWMPLNSFAKYVYLKFTYFVKENKYQMKEWI